MIDFNLPTDYDHMDYDTFYDTCRGCTGYPLSETERKWWWVKSSE